MNYPSLLYKNKSTLKPIDISVFEDLQLLNFFDRSTAEAISIPCDKDSILARQKLFKQLFVSENLAKFQKLYECIKKVTLLNEIYSGSRCDEERNFIFLSLIRKVKDFSECASDCGFNDELTSRFSESFSLFLSKTFDETMINRIDCLTEKLNKVCLQAFKLHEQSIYVVDAKHDTYLTKILNCSDMLGIDRKKIVPAEMNATRISPDIIKSISKKNGDVFDEISDFYKQYNGIFNADICKYKEELKFYISMMNFLNLITDHNIPLNFPQTIDEKTFKVYDAYDVSLLAKKEDRIVPNDIEFTPKEPFYYLTGANGGGKTTYLRAVGISAVLYLNGCPLPCKSAVFGGIESVYTHFPKDERFDGSGRFVEENRRVEKILSEINSGSIVLLNETYSTTNEENAVYMTEKLADKLYNRGTFGLYITHQHSLSKSEIPYLNVQIDGLDGNKRTYKIAKQKNIGSSFALDILKKYKLTLNDLTKRFGEI